MTLREQYVKQRKRIQSSISSMRKRGYIIPESLLPAIPKRITQSSVSRLTKIKPANIRSKSQFVDIRTGEITTGTQGIKIERQYSAEKAKETRRRKQKRLQAEQASPASESSLIWARLQKAITDCESNGRGSDATYIRALVTKQVNEEGMSNFMSRMNSVDTSDLSAILDTIAYGSGETYRHGLSAFAELILGRRMTASEAKEISEEMARFENGQPEFGEWL